MQIRRFFPRVFLELCTLSIRKFGGSEPDVFFFRMMEEVEIF